MLKHHANPRLVAALCALSLSACGPAPTSNPSVNPSALPSANPSPNPSAQASAAVPGVTTALTVHLQADAGLAGFATTQQGLFNLCLGQITNAETRIMGGTQVSGRQSLTLRQLLAGVDFTLSGVALGPVSGRTGFFDADGVELGFVNWQAEANPGARVSILLRANAETDAGDSCPSLDASISGGTLQGSDGQPAVIPPVPAATPRPSATPTASSAPGVGPAAPLNVQVVEQTNSSLTLQWEFPADARSFRLFLDGSQVATDYVTPNYYRFEGLRENTTYRLGVQSVNAAGASEVVTLTSATVNGHSGSGNFSGGGSSRGRASASPEPLGEFRVPDFTTNYQSSSGVAMDADGDFVVSWTDYTSGDGDIYARRFHANGSHNGSAFRVNTYTDGHQLMSSVALDDDGNFVVCWVDFSQDGSGYGVYARRYGPSGPLDASEFLVNTYTTNDQTSPDVALNNAGEFIITWTDLTQDGSNNGIYARRYNSVGPLDASEFLVNTYTTSLQNGSAIALDDAGDFVIAWADYSLDGSYTGVFARRYTSLGPVDASEFIVNTVTDQDQSDADVALNENGEFIVTWTDNGGLDGDRSGIFARRFNTQGPLDASQFSVNAISAGFQVGSSVALGADGDFVIIWYSSLSIRGDQNILARRFSSSGPLDESEFLVNSYTTDRQLDPHLARDADGNFAVFWTSNGQDGPIRSVYGQLYSADGTPR